MATNPPCGPLANGLEHSLPQGLAFVPLFLKVQSMDQQHCYHLETC